MMNSLPEKRKKKSRFKDIFVAIFIAGVAVFGFYYFIAIELLTGGLGAVEAFQTNISIKIRDQKKGWVEKRVSYWRDEKGRFVFKSDFEGKVEKILSDGNICWREKGAGPEYYELDLQLRPFEFDYTFGRFFMDNEESIPDLRVFSEQTILGRLCRHYLFRSKFEPDTSYEIWVDRQFGLPVMLEKTVKEIKVLRLEIETLSRSNQVPGEIEATSVAAIRNQLQDPYSNYRIPFSALGSLSGIRPAIPSKVPGDLKSPTFYLFPAEKFTEKLVGSPERNVLVVVYRDQSRYLQLFEYRGRKKDINVQDARVEKLKDREVHIFALPGFWWAQTQLGDMVVNIKTNIKYQEMIDTISSLGR